MDCDTYNRINEDSIVLFLASRAELFIKKLIKHIF